MKIWGSLVMVLLTLQATAQNFPSEVWHNGKVVLITKETHKGKVKYDLETDIVQVNVDNIVLTFSSKKILYFEIFDESTSTGTATTGDVTGGGSTATAGPV